MRIKKADLSKLGITTELKFTVGKWGQTNTDRQEPVFGISIIFKDCVPFALCYWSDLPRFCTFCGSFEENCRHGGELENGQMIGWDVKMLHRSWIDYQTVPIFNEEWWTLDEGAVNFVKLWMTKTSYSPR